MMNASTSQSETSSTSHSLLYSAYKSYILRLILLLGALSLTFALLATYGARTATFMFVGGILGAISSVRLDYGLFDIAACLCLFVIIGVCHA
jgi:hypothetical protein